MASGATSGSKTFTTGFTPVEIVIYNDSPADIYYADGLFSTKPGATIRIPPNTDMPIPYTQNAQGFTLFWESTSVLTQTYQIIVKWSDVPLAVPYTPLTQQVSVANSVTISVTQSGSWNVSINNQPTVNVNGPVSVQGVTGGTAIGVSISSSVALNVQQSGTWTVNIGTMPNVNVNGPITVEGVSGGTAIGVSISSSVALNVQQSGTWTVDINTMPTVNINGPITVEGVSGGTAIGVQVQNNITINGTVTVQFPSAQEVTLAATGPVDIQNLLLSDNNLVFLYELQGTIASFASGASISSGGDGLSSVTFKVGQSQIGLFDGYFILLLSAKATYTAGSVGQIGINNGGQMTDFNSYQVFGAGTVIGDQNPQNNGPAGYGMIGPIFLSSPAVFNLVKHNVTNNTGATVTDDTLTFWVFGIKAQVSNPVENPVQQQAASGEYDSLVGTNGGSNDAVTASTVTTVIGAGGYITEVTLTQPITLQVGGTDGYTNTVVLNVGGQQIAYASTTNNASIPAGTYKLSGRGIYNAGVNITVASTAPSGWTGLLTWGGIFTSESSVTPPAEVTSVA